MKLFRLILLPLSALWYAISGIRTWLYGKGLLRRRRFRLPVFVVGNLSTGGTGKSPHAELLARRMMEQGYRTALLSRGYGRRTKGFLEVSQHDSARRTGDEPLMLKRALPEATVAVCENRARGIRQLMRRFRPQVIVLDDAYQHLRVKASCYFLLTAFDQPFTSDHLLPAGNLRESRHGARRADCVIVTKVPRRYADSAERACAAREKLRRQIARYTDAPVVFSRYHYADRVKNPLLGHIATEDLKDYNILLVTAVANPIPLLSHLGSIEVTCRHLQYPDHHVFRHRDVEKIKNEFLNLPRGKNIILTTEKDMARIIGTPLAEYPVYSLAIRAEILPEDQAAFEAIVEQTLARYKDHKES